MQTMIGRIDSSLWYIHRVVLPLSKSFQILWHERPWITKALKVNIRRKTIVRDKCVKLYLKNTHTQHIKRIQTIITQVSKESGAL